MAEVLVKGTFFPLTVVHLANLCSGEIQVEKGLEEFSAALMAEAKTIVDSKAGWVVGFIMIDKSQPSILAIRRGMV